MASLPGQSEPPTDDGQPPVSPGDSNEQGVTPILPLDPTTPPTGEGTSNGEEPEVTVQEPPPVDEEPPPVDEEPSANLFVENSGQDCEIPALPNANALPSINTLPDPFLGLDGQRITTRAEWRCRRQEILKLAERFIYGEKALRPQSVTGTVVNNRITVNVQNAGQTATFNATITLPPGANGRVLHGESWPCVERHAGRLGVGRQPHDRRHRRIWRSDHQSPSHRRDRLLALGKGRFHGGRLRYIQEGAHCVFRNEFVAPLQQNIRKFLKNEANASTGSINAHATRTGNLARTSTGRPRLSNNWRAAEEQRVDLRSSGAGPPPRVPERHLGARCVNVRGITGVA